MRKIVWKDCSSEIEDICMNENAMDKFLRETEKEKEESLLIMEHSLELLYQKFQI